MAEQNNIGKQQYRGIYPGIRLRDKISWIFSDLADHDSSLCRVIEPMILYPYVKWSQRGMDLDNVIRIGSKALYDKTREFSDMTEFESALQLDRRNQYYELSVPFVDQMEELEDSLILRGAKGIYYQSVFQTVLGDTDSPCSLYVLDKYLPEVVELLYRTELDAIEESYVPLMDFILKKKPEEDSDLYHNVEELIDKYEELRYSQNAADEALKRLLDCQTPEDYLTVLTNPNLNDMISASHISQFLSIIASAIPILREYPVNGERYYDIVIGLTEKRYAHSDTRHFHRKTDGEIGSSFSMKKSNFSRRKRDAFETLGLILWGVDRTILIKTGILSFE